MSSVYVTSATPKNDFILTAEMFTERRIEYDVPDILYSFNAGHFGRVTVLDRMTGYGYRDTESALRTFNGYSDARYGEFYLTSGEFDIRDGLPMRFSLISQMLKETANNR